jgi:beta-galactosidase
LVYTPVHCIIAAADGMRRDSGRVSTPHTYNDIDTFNKIISHGGGQRGAYMGPAWYRRHFKLPQELQRSRNLFIEFEGMKQAGDIYVNGKQLGLYENGVTAYGVDITDAVQFGDADNVLAVRVDNGKYSEKSSGVGFEWEANDFNPNYGGINRHVWLHVTGKVHQTLPLYYGLETTGIYIYPSNVSPLRPHHRCQYRLAGGQRIGRSGIGQPRAVVVDADGQVRAKFDGDTIDLVNGEKTELKATGKLDRRPALEPG